MQRSLLIFENSIKSEATKKEYLKSLHRFMNFYHLKDFDGILRIQSSKLQIMVEDYVMHLKKSVSPNTIPTRFYPIQTFLETNDIDLKWKKIRRLFPALLKKSGNKAWTTKEIQLMLERALDLRSKALIHFLASTGCRVGALPELRLKHLAETPMGCKSVLVYPDSTEEYYTFLTPEASEALDAYFNKRRNDGEHLIPDSPVFRSNYRIGIEKVTPITDRAITQVMQRVIVKANLRKNKAGKRYDTQVNHGFRKRFNTILKLNKQVNDNIIEKMMGHKRGLDGVYFIPTREECFEEYLKGISDLTISDSERLRQKNLKLEEEKSELENKQIEIENLKQNDVLNADAITNLSDRMMTLSKELEELKRRPHLTHS